VKWVRATASKLFSLEAGWFLLQKPHLRFCNKMAVMKLFFVEPDFGAVALEMGVF
jgi:hypothetical protein